MSTQSTRLITAFLLTALAFAAFGQEAPAAHAPLGIWIGQEEIDRLPTSGRAWENLKSNADESVGVPDTSNQDDPTNLAIMAKALVYEGYLGDRASYSSFEYGDLSWQADPGRPVGRWH